jgi:hypothetical protein
VLLKDPGRDKSQITNVVCQIQRFDFDCNLVVKRKVIMGIPPALVDLGGNPCKKACMPGGCGRHSLAFRRSSPCRQISRNASQKHLCYQKLMYGGDKSSVPD